MEVIKNSVYWKSEIEKTEEVLANLIKGETAGVKSAKNDSDSLTYQDIGDFAKECRNYISYCQKQYEKALEEEGKKVKEKNKSILYFTRSEYGY